MKRCETCKHWEKNKGNYLKDFGCVMHEEGKYVAE